VATDFIFQEVLVKLQKVSVRGFLAVAMMLAAPASALAQACVGMPIGSGQSAVAFNMAFPEDATTFGIAGRMHTAGPVSVGADYSLTSFKNVDPKLHGFGADVAYELAVTEASICPVVGAGYSRISEDGVSVSNLSIPFGVGLGMSMAAGDNAEFVPHVVPQVIWSRASFGVGGVSVSESDTFFGVKLGATYRLQQIMVNAGVTLTSEEGSKALFGLGLGFAL
jgi:hypothetical protein